MDSDPDLEIIEKDSGMSSLGGSKDETPERKAVIEDVNEESEAKNMVAVNSSSVADDEPENYDDEPDESLAERLFGLTEMFPEGVRTACESITDFSINSTKAMYKFSCNASWIFFTSSMILFAPVLFETERAQMAELEMSQKQRVLLGPGAAAISGGGAPGMPALPPVSR